jgi:recombinational DNA repair ATPase RecF
MVKFRITLDLHNFNKLEKLHDSKMKIKGKKIMRFYKQLAKLITYDHNNEIKHLQKIAKGYCEPLIAITKCMFIFPNNPKVLEGAPDDENAFLSDLINKINPPVLQIDFEYKISPKSEDVAIKRFKKDYVKSITFRTKTELHNIFYSTQIINFTNKLRSYLDKGIYWKLFRTKIDINTKYKPRISVSNTAVLSLQ